MYATFEEFIDNHTSFGNGKPGDPDSIPTTTASGSDTRRDVFVELESTRSQVRPSQVNRRATIGGTSYSGVVGGTGGTSREGVSSASGIGALDLESDGRKRSTMAGVVTSAVPGSKLTQQKVEFQFDMGLTERSDNRRDFKFGIDKAGFSESIGGGSGSRLGSSKDDLSLIYRKPHHRSRYRRTRKRLDIANPLLETISAIQDLCESDDYSELPGHSYYGGQGLSARFYASSDIDKDSIGYAGSNSIDSGYKSSCPTPELSDGTYYGSDAAGLSGSKRGSITSQGSQGNMNQKPRIPMGTKVMNRNSHPQYQRASFFSSTSTVDGSRRTGSLGDSSYYDVDLDHLMYLRQSILSAMQRYERVADSNRGGRRSLPLSPRNRSPSRYSPRTRSPCRTANQDTANVDFVSPRNPSSPTSRSFQSPLSSPRQRSKSPLETGFRPRSASASSRTGSSPSSPKRSSSGYRSASPGGPGSSPMSQRRSLSPLAGVTYSTRGIGTSLSGRTDSPPVYGRASYPSSRTQSPCYSSASNGSGKSSPGYQKGFANRFGTKLELSVASPKKNISNASMCPAGKTPLSPDEPMLEEEIDTLLYGRSDYQEVEQDDLPCNYVTMIEDKYRRSSIARVKKLREKSRGVPDSSSSSDSYSTSPTHQPVPQQSSRFSEVAKCMLEIIEDLQTQQAQGIQKSPVTEQGKVQNKADSVVAAANPAEASSTTTVTEVSSATTQQQQQQQSKSENSQTSASSCKGPESACATKVEPEKDCSKKAKASSEGTYQSMKGGGATADYHVYEEIMYEMMAHKEDPVPPPLPARPNGIFRSLKSSDSKADAEVVAKCSQLSPAHQPKQRSNIYSLFADQSDRRNISQSLEKEYMDNKEGQTEEEYGFRVLA